MTDLTAPAKDQQIRTTVPSIEQRVSATPAPDQGRSHLLKGDAEWGWAELRDYVVTEVTARHGAFPRDPRKEAAVFKRFVKDFQELAPVVARYAFEVADGYWNGAPISINRFTKNSDEWFAWPILESLAAD